MLKEKKKERKMLRLPNRLSDTRLTSSGLHNTPTNLFQLNKDCTCIPVQTSSTFVSKIGRLT